MFANATTHSNDTTTWWESNVARRHKVALVIGACAALGLGALSIAGSASALAPTYACATVGCNSNISLMTSGSTASPQLTVGGGYTPSSSTVQTSALQDGGVVVPCQNPLCRCTKAAARWDGGIACCDACARTVNGVTRGRGACACGDPDCASRRNLSILE